jgi:hypothetical protein
MPDWSYTDYDGDRLRVGPRLPGSLLLGVANRDDDVAVVVKAADLSEIVAHMYEAAGLPAPIILDRPAPRDVLVPDPHGGDDVAVTPSPAGHPGNLPGVSLRVGGEPDGYAAVRLIYDEPLRVAVALIDAMREAEQAPDEPDPREVAGLARALHRTHCVPNGCCTEEPSAGDLDEARTALRWMQDKQREAAK